MGFERFPSKAHMRMIISAHIRGYVTRAESQAADASFWRGITEDW